MKNIVICCDGTWNTPDDLDNGALAPTNVVKLWHAVSPQVDAGNAQHTYYHPGVGTERSWWSKAIDGGTGRGLNRNIMSAYRNLSEHYQAGDRIFLFGFSRGAYTVRSLAGMIGRCGLLNSTGLPEGEIWRRIERVFELGYRKRTEETSNWRAEGWTFHDGPGKPNSIHFVGVWDTVGALGVPDDMAFLNLLDSLEDYTFHDTELGPAVATARHAVALDEMRASFQPTLWTSVAEGRDVQQRWFPGVHSDVGGGYAECGLSDAALLWMIGEAKKAGLAFDANVVGQIAADVQGCLHNSCAGVFAHLPTLPRAVPRINPPDPTIDEVVKLRCRIPSVRQGAYRSERVLGAGDTQVLDIFASQPWNCSGIWLDGGATYTFQAKGEWMDSTIACGPGGTRDGKFQLAEAAQVLGTVWGKVEGLWKKLGRNEAADFRFTKRYENWPWFSLIGVVANGGGVDSNQRLIPHEAFLIGDGCQYSPQKSGYFFAFANDALNCYGNNRGRLELKVSRNR